MWNCGMFRHLSALAAPAVLAAVASAPHPAFAVPPPHWKDSGYSYNAKGTPLKRVLQAFAQSHGIELKLSGEFNQVVTARIQGATVMEFLDRLGIAHHFQWFFYNNALYISPAAESVFERIDVASDTVAEAKAALSGLGLFEPKFGWGELQEERLIAISGPAEYIRLVKQVIRSDAAKKDDSEAMVFRLKYAAVDDRQVTVREAVTVTPGVATILKNMLSGRDNRNARDHGPGDSVPLSAPFGMNMPMVEPPTLLSNRIPMIGSAGVMPQSAPPQQMPSQAQRFQRFSSAGANRAARVAVEGDVRTNSVVIWDSPSKRAYYQRLIDALDTPQRLVEIEAVIVDISQDRLKEIGGDFIIGNSRRNVGVSPVAALASRGLSGATIVLQSVDHFFAQLRMLESDGEARILAKPSVMTLENLMAVLDLSQTVFIKSTGERVAQVTPVTAGTMLRVTPRVIEEQSGPRVHLTVDIEDGKISDGGPETPEVQRSTISTQAILQNQESLVIGGYNSDSSGQKLQGIPGLSKVPLFGALFANNQSGSQSRQRLFIITPRLVATPGSTATAAASVPDPVSRAAGTGDVRLRMSSDVSDGPEPPDLVRLSR
jgi:type III secretion protein C